jgi:hypothetical protein
LIPAEGTNEAYYGLGISCKGDGALKIYNNTVYQMAQHYSLVTLADLNSSIHANNLSLEPIYIPSTGASNHIRLGTFNKSNMTVNHNLYWPDGALFPTTGGSFAAHQGQGWDVDGVCADPDLDAGLRPQAGSPAAGAGMLIEQGQRWLGNVTWPVGTDGGSFEFVDLTSAPTIGAFAENI